VLSCVNVNVSGTCRIVPSQHEKGILSSHCLCTDISLRYTRFSFWVLGSSGRCSYLVHDDWWNRRLTATCFSDSFTLRGKIGARSNIPCQLFALRYPTLHLLYIITLPCVLSGCVCSPGNANDPLARVRLTAVYRIVRERNNRTIAFVIPTFYIAQTPRYCFESIGRYLELVHKTEDDERQTCMGGRSKYL
jgi:hypothetical protein